MKALKIVCGKPDENLQPLQAGHIDLHVYVIWKVYRAQASKFVSPGYIIRKAFYISCAVSETKVCVQTSKENNYDSSHISSSYLMMLFIQGSLLCSGKLFAFKR